jgi:hypothetical protein
VHFDDANAVLPLAMFGHGDALIDRKGAVGVLSEHAHGLVMNDLGADADRCCAIRLTVDDREPAIGG